MGVVAFVGPIASASTAAAPAPYVPPQLTNMTVQNATLNISLKYAGAEPGLDARTLRWFLYAVEHRESTFSTSFCNYNDGAANWNSPPSLASFWPTTDHVPHGCGVVQLTGWTHEGMPYPDNAATSPTTINKGIYGIVAVPKPIPALTNPFDPQQNLERFVTEEVLPDYVALEKTYPSYTPAQLLRAVAFHWNKGEWIAYDPNNCDYLCLYDQYVGIYEPAVMNDTAWPPATSTTTTTTTSTTTTTTTTTTNASSSGSSTATNTSTSTSTRGTSANGTTSTSGTTSTTTGATSTTSGATTPSPPPPPVSFSVSGGTNAWWVDVAAKPAAGQGTVADVEVIVNGAAPVTLPPDSWGTWAKSIYVPKGARVTFLAATTNGIAVRSATFDWLVPSSTAGLPSGPWAIVSPATTVTVNFHLTSGVNAWWVEVVATPSSGSLSSVTASVNGGTPVALTHESWGSWAKSFYVAPGAKVVFTAKTSTGVVFVSAPASWP
ncbi:MAG: hypothetical protein ACYDDF_13890 [Thermoplasmatota archaeon]